MSDEKIAPQLSLVYQAKEPQPEILVHQFGEMELRCVLRSGEPWFFAVDVCKHLALEDTTSALRRLDEDEKSNLSSPAGGAGWNIVNESGLYVLVFQSKKAEAVAYRKWVTSEVLPSIRRTGQYSKAPTEEQQLAIAEQAVIGWRRAREETQALRLQREIDAPKVATAEMIGNSKQLHAFRYSANKFAIPQNQFLELLEDWGLIYHQSGRWQPHAPAVHNLLIKDIVTDDGYPQAKVTGKGLVYIAQRLNKEGLMPWPKKGRPR